MGRPLITFAGNDITPSATSIFLNTVNSTYPPQNLQDYDPATPSKANSITATWTFIFSTAYTPAFVAAINQNFAGASAITFGNSLGFVTSLAPQTRTLGFQCDNPWTSLTGGSRTSSIFFLTVTGCTTLAAVGAVPICTSVAFLPVRWGSGTGPDQEADYLDVEAGRTFYGTLITYPKGVRVRRFEGQVITDAGRSLVELCNESAQGRRYPFVLVPDSDVNSAIWVSFANTKFRYQRTGMIATNTEFVAEERSQSVPL